MALLITNAITQDIFEKHFTFFCSSTDLYLAMTYIQLRTLEKVGRVLTTSIQYVIHVERDGSFIAA